MGGDQYDAGNDFGYFDPTQHGAPSYSSYNNDWTKNTYSGAGIPPLNTTNWDDENLTIDMLMSWIASESDGTMYGASRMWTALSTYIKDYRDSHLIPQANMLKAAWDPSISKASATFLENVGKSKNSIDEWVTWFDQNASATKSVADQIKQTRSEMQTLYQQYKKDYGAEVKLANEDANTSGFELVLAEMGGFDKEQAAQDHAKNLADITKNYSKQAREKMKVLASSYTSNWGALNEGQKYKGPTNSVNPATVLMSMIQDLFNQQKAAAASAAAAAAAAQKKMAAAQAAAQKQMAAQQAAMKKKMQEAQAAAQKQMEQLQAAQQQMQQLQQQEQQKLLAQQKLLQQQQQEAQQQMQAAQQLAQNKMIAAQQAFNQQQAAAQQAMQQHAFPPLAALPGAAGPNGLVGTPTSTFNGLGTPRTTFPTGGMPEGTSGSPLAGRPNLNGLSGGGSGMGMGRPPGSQSMNPGLRGRLGAGGEPEGGGGRPPLGGRRGEQDGKKPGEQPPAQSNFRPESEEYLAGTSLTPNQMTARLAGQPSFSDAATGIPPRPSMPGRMGGAGGPGGPRGPQQPGAPRGNRRLTKEELGGRRKRMADAEEEELELLAPPRMADRPDLNGRNSMPEVDWEDFGAPAEMGAEREMLGTRAAPPEPGRVPGQPGTTGLGGRRKDEDAEKQKKEQQEQAEAATVEAAGEELWTVDQPKTIEAPVEKKVEQEQRNVLG
jgi:chemotaxis protein histidine kinase CheA